MSKKTEKKSYPSFNPGERFVFTTFVNRAQKIGYTPEEAKTIFDQMMKEGKIQAAGSIGILKNVKVYQIACV